MNKTVIIIGSLLGLGIVGYLVYKKMNTDVAAEEVPTPQPIEPPIDMGVPPIPPNPINTGNGSNVAAQLGISPTSKFTMVGQKSIGSGALMTVLPIRANETPQAYLDRVSSTCLNDVRCKAFTNQGKLYNATTNVFDTTNQYIKLYIKS